MAASGRTGRGRRTFRAVGQSLGACFHTFVFAAYPVLLVTAANAGVLPLEGAAVARALGVSVLLAAALLLALAPVVPDLRTRAACLSIVFLGFSLYGLIAGDSTHAGGAALYVAASVLAAAALVRPWTGRPRRSAPLNAGAGLLLAVNLYGAAPALGSQAPWRPPADVLIAGVVASSGGALSGVPRDIYYVVLDGFGRPDVLRELYDLDLSPFVSALEARGFVLPAAGRSNYAQTYLSLGSSLNLSYLEAIATPMGGSPDRRALDYLIQHNALTTLARRAGYRVVAIGSDYAATARLRSADECRCEQYGPSELELAALNLTPLRALPLERWTYEAHRRKLEASFRHLEDVAGDGAPMLVFAHLIAPHPPFVFGAEGGRRSSGSRVFGFHDGSDYAGSRAEYVAGYRDQAQFVARRILAVVDAILSRPGPAPVIVLQGDHGPGSMWDWTDPAGGDTRERLAIFSAYHFPGADPPDLPAGLSPVNGMRILANRQLGTALPALPDLSFVSTWRQPYALVPVDANDRIVRGPDAAGHPVQR